MKLKVGMVLELTKDLDCGVKIIDKGEKFEVNKINDNGQIVLRNNIIGIGVFNELEIEEYFKEYIKEVKQDNDVQRVIYSNNVTVVILKSGIKGISKCLEGDVYNEEVGYRVAYLKAKIKEMNKELKKY